MEHSGGRARAGRDSRPQGRAAEFSSYYGAKGGRLAIALNLASNDLPGEWAIRVKELASGLSGERTLRVEP